MLIINRNRNRWPVILLLALLLALVCGMAAAEVMIDSRHFPDDNFRAYILEKWDGDENGNGKDGVLRDAEIAAAKTIDCRGLNISSLEGIKYFTSMTSLLCEENNLTSLDVSGCTKLQYLSSFTNKLSSVNLAGCTSLTYLSVASNPLSSVDVSQCTALEALFCYNSKLTSLDISKCVKLEHLSAFNNRLTSLDVSKNTALTFLACHDNNLTLLDVRNCEVLNRLVVEEQPTEKQGVYPYYIWTDGDSSHYLYAGKSVNILTTANPPVAVTEINLNRISATLIRRSNETRPTLQLIATVLPENATYPSVKWVASTVSVVKVNSKGKVTALKPGTALVFCISTENNAIAAVCKITVENQQVDRITLNKTEATLTRTGKNKNPTLQLKATLLHKDAINTALTWTSNKPKIAKVDKNGKVTALKAGTAKITCKAEDGSATDTCIVTVKDAKVTKITLNKTKAKMSVGKTLQLKVKKFTPASPLNTEVKWITSDKKIATVDKNGKVTAKKAGLVVITCAATDGSKKFATCKITVK